LNIKAIPRNAMIFEMNFFISILIKIENR
jgi:hypothetical protein